LAAGGDVLQHRGVEGEVNSSPNWKETESWRRSPERRKVVVFQSRSGEGRQLWLLGSGQMVSGDGGGGGGMLKCEQEAVEDGGVVKGCNGCHSVAFN
jgi:hypothetical protein